jgi:hypothetical protein
VFGSYCLSFDSGRQNFLSHLLRHPDTAREEVLHEAAFECLELVTMLMIDCDSGIESREYGSEVSSFGERWNRNQIMEKHIL